LGKIAVSATLLGLLVRRISWAELRGELQQTHVPALIVPFAIILISNVLGAAQWHWILRAAGVGSGFWRVLRAYTIGLFLNNFMLGTVGGDVYKIYTLGRQSEMRRVAGATIVDRVIAMSALCTLALVAALAEAAARPRAGGADAGRHRVRPLHHGHGGAPAASALWRSAGAALGGVAARSASGRVLARLVDHLRDYRQQPRLLNRMFLLSLVIQASRVVAHFCVGLAMGWPLHVADLGKFFVVIPILGLIIALPISIGGWGVREWAGMALFGPLGHGGEEAVTLLALTAC
jgi:uncharacterized membrane protein YbhN (UPF0104 family)